MPKGFFVNLRKDTPLRDRGKLGTPPLPGEGIRSKVWLGWPLVTRQQEASLRGGISPWMGVSRGLAEVARLHNGTPVFSWMSLLYYFPPLWPLLNRTLGCCFSWCYFGEGNKIRCCYSYLLSFVNSFAHTVSTVISEELAVLQTGKTRFCAFLFLAHDLLHCVCF